MKRLLLVRQLARPVCWRRLLRRRLRRRLGQGVLKRLLLVPPLGELQRSQLCRFKRFLQQLAEPLCELRRLMWGRLCLLRLRVLKRLLLQWHLAGTLCNLWRFLRGHLW